MAGRYSDQPNDPPGKFRPWYCGDYGCSCDDSCPYMRRNKWTQDWLKRALEAWESSVERAWAIELGLADIPMPRQGDGDRIYDRMERLDLVEREHIR